MNSDDGLRIERVHANGIDVEVASTGTGDAILLLHGWPHTWRLWQPVMTWLSRTHRVIAPDLRGIGGTTRATSGYDAETLARDQIELLDALGVARATVVGIDAGVPIAAMLGLGHPARVERLALTEGLIGTLPGAETFLAHGPPWWFGFHAVPGLAEAVVEGHEADYIGWFLASGTADGRGVDSEVRDAFIAAYTGREALRCGFEHYRAAGTSAKQIEAAVSCGRFGMPTLSLEGGLVGAAVSKQLEAVSSNFRSRRIEGCGHLVPLEQPNAFAEAIRDFMF